MNYPGDDSTAAVVRVVIVRRSPLTLSHEYLVPNICRGLKHLSLTKVLGSLVAQVMRAVCDRYRPEKKNNVRL